MKLSIVIPVFNESATFEEILSRVESCPVDFQKQIIVVDDASTDGSADLIRAAADAGRIHACFHKTNQGKGAALRTGFEHVSGDIVLIQDADLEYSTEDYPKLLGPILDGRADVVFGSRFVGGDSHRVLYFWHSLGNRFLTMLSNMLTNLNMTDMETCYKVFKREVLDQVKIEENRFGFEPEITAKISKLRFDGRPICIYEVGISYAGRTYGEGKKIGWRDGAAALWCILKYNLFRS